MTKYFKGALGLATAAILVGGGTGTATADAADAANGTENGTQNGTDNDERPVVATASPSDAPITLEAQINGIDRASAGGLASLTYTIAHTGTEDDDGERLSRILTDGEHDDGSSTFNGPTLLDEANDVRYFSVGMEDYCLCPDGAGSSSPNMVEPGDSQALWLAFILPDDLASVTVEIPGFESIEGVEVT